MERIQNTLDLAKSSWRVLKSDKELAWLPVISALLSLGVLLILVAALAAGGNLTTEEGGDTSPMVWVLGLIAFAVIAVISVFFQGALVAGAHQRLTGGDPTVSSSMSAASAKMHRIIPWALLNMTVGMILRSLRERGGIIGAMAGWIGETAWNLLTFLAVPVLMIEDLGPIDTVKRSGALFKRTWGENVAAQVGFGLLGFVAVLPALLIGGLFFAVGGPVAVLGIVLFVAYVAAVIIAISALSGIFQTALYMYAAEGTIPVGFEGTSLPTSFR